LDSDIALDASAFYAGMAFLAGKGRLITTSAIFEEVKHVNPVAVDALIHAGNLSLFEPSKENSHHIILVAKKTGDIAKLSAADISILALAFERRAILASDDYAVANVASAIGLQVVTSPGKGIKETRRYITYCSACGKAFSPLEKECPLCGNALKRRYKKVTR
jgi:UPF0271 protein